MHLFCIFHSLESDLYNNNYYYYNKGKKGKGSV